MTQLFIFEIPAECEDLSVTELQFPADHHLSYRLSSKLVLDQANWAGWPVQTFHPQQSQHSWQQRQHCSHMNRVQQGMEKQISFEAPQSLESTVVKDIYIWATPANSIRSCFLASTWPQFHQMQAYGRHIMVKHCWKYLLQIGRWEYYVKSDDNIC